MSRSAGKHEGLLTSTDGAGSRAGDTRPRDGRIGRGAVVVGVTALTLAAWTGEVASSIRRLGPVAAVA